MTANPPFCAAVVQQVLPVHALVTKSVANVNGLLSWQLTFGQAATLAL